MQKITSSHIIPLFLIVIAGCSQETPQKKSKDGYVKVSEDIELYYRLTGSTTAQDTIVVVHGGPGAGMKAVLDPLLPLAEQFVLLFYDQRGGGKSSLPQDTELLQGTSENPVENCREYEKINRILAEKRGEAVTWTGTVCDAPPEAVAYYYQFTAQITPRTFGNWDYTSGMDHVSSPLLVIHGEKDTLGALSQQLWVEAFPNGRLSVIKEAGKSAITDQPEVVFPQIAGFFGNNT